MTTAIRRCDDQTILDAAERIGVERGHVSVSVGEARRAPAGQDHLCALLKLHRAIGNRAFQRLVRRSDATHPTRPERTRLRPLQRQHGPGAAATHLQFDPPRLPDRIIFPRIPLPPLLRRMLHQRLAALTGGEPLRLRYPTAGAATSVASVDQLSQVPDLVLSPPESLRRPLPDTDPWWQPSASLQFNVPFFVARRDQSGFVPVQFNLQAAFPWLYAVRDWRSHPLTVGDIQPLEHFNWLGGPTLSLSGGADLSGDFHLAAQVIAYLVSLHFSHGEGSLQEDDDFALGGGAQEDWDTRSGALTPSGVVQLSWTRTHATSGPFQVPFGASMSAVFDGQHLSNVVLSVTFFGGQLAHPPGGNVPRREPPAAEEEYR